MPQPPSLAIVLEGGNIQWLIAEDWPAGLAPLRIVIIDYDTEDYRDDELTRFTISDHEVKAACKAATPVVSESFEKFLSPKAVLAAMGQPVEAEPTSSPLALARVMRAKIQEIDDELNRNERSPTGDDYNRLYAVTNGWLIDILQVLGAEPD